MGVEFFKVIPSLEEFIFEYFNEMYPNEMREVLATYEAAFPKSDLKEGANES